MIGGMELVRDKQTRESLPPEAGLGTKLDANARRNGLILRIAGNRIAFSPPLIITAEEVKELAKRLRQTLDDTWQEVRAS